ncbi:MAG: APC family permease [Candidatus Acidiferrales bacterium]
MKRATSEHRKNLGVTPRAMRKMTLAGMIAATYFMVAGGPYGLEDVVQKTGYAGTLLILILTPILWSIPTAWMVSELSTALPEDGGFYIWVRRGMGHFWGFQEAWLTLTGSLLEMALYPVLFVSYLERFVPRMAAGYTGVALELAIIVACTAWNILGAGAVGEASVWLNVALLLPFVGVVIAALARSHAASAAPVSATPLLHADLIGALLIAMWNYMGWDNLSTVAGETERPRRNYPLAMAGAVALVTLSYLIPVGAVARTGLDPNQWTTGGWVDVGQLLGGTLLALAVAIAGMLGAFGTFGSLMMSFSRLPVVLAEDGYLPRVFARKYRRTGAPWVAIVVCAIGWAALLPLGFERLVLLDVLLTGLSILLEFWALVALRVREPELARPSRVPGGIAGTVLIGLPPLALLVLAGVRERTEKIGPVSELTVGGIVVLLGVVVYMFGRWRRERIAAPGGPY